MKHYLPNSLRALFLSLAVILSLPMLAVEVEIDGINYDLVAKSKKIATVVKKSSGKYSGEVVIPESVEHEGAAYSVTSIGWEAFYSCSGLTSVTIPNSVTSIGDDAFWYCYGLTSVTIPNSVTSIGEQAFYKCSGLTSVTIPNSVTSIGRYAFYGCSGLTSVTIPNSVTSIGESAFSYCSGLTSVTIPNSVTIIGEGVFYGCSGLTSVHISDLAAWCNVDFEYYDSNPLYYAHHLYLNGEEVKDLVIPNSVKSIGNFAFDGCSGLTSVTIPNSVTRIGERAFRECSGLTSVHISDITAWCNIDFEGIYVNSNPLYYAHHLYLNGEEVKDLVIPNSVTSIGDYAFSGFSGLTSVTIPNSVTRIGWDAFNGCSGLASVTIGNSVTGIGQSAFSGCSGLTSVHISDIAAWCNIDFSYSGSNPLYYAHHLYLNGEEVKDLVIPNSVTSIGESAFAYCNGLISVTIGNSVKSIGGYAFLGCSGLTSVTIPNSVTSIGERAFLGCSGLISVTIPNSVTSIGENAFYGCSGLTSVTIPNSVRSIEEYAFQGCSGLTSVTIPNSVTSIASFAFEGCSGLTSVTIGNGVTSIGWKAFANCSELLDVYCYAEKVPSTKSDTFNGSYPKKATLHVPDASIDSYKATAPWSGFGKIVGLSGEETQMEKCATPVVTYVDGCLEISCETEGAEFVTEIASNDFKKHYVSKIELSATYNIEVFATKANCENSDTVSVALVWVENGEVNEETGVISVPAAPVLVQGNGGILTVSGVVQNTEVVVYTIDGIEVDRAVACDGTATIYTGLQSGTIVVVKFGNKSVKVRI